MSSTCIVTDGTVQFNKPFFIGQELIRIIPHQISINHQIVNQPQSWKPSQLPTYAGENLRPHLLPPSIEDFVRQFLDIGQNFDNILGVFTSSQLSHCYENAQAAVDFLHGRHNILLIDSQTISLGLGYLVQTAACAIADNKPLDSVEQILRSIIPDIFTILCTPGISYLYYNNFINKEQAIICEMLSLFPIFTLEEGQLTPVEKSRNRHQTLEYFMEFIDEFDHLKLISLLQSNPSNNNDLRVLRDHVQENFPTTPFSEHNLNLHLAVLFGPKALGLFIIEGKNSP